MAEMGTFYWNELMTRDAEAAKAFYANTLGWTYDSTPMPNLGEYHVAKRGDTMVAGIMEISGPDYEGVQDNWFSYIAVDDLGFRLSLAKESGGAVLREPFDVPGIGRIAIIAAPGGAIQGWIQPAPQSM